MNDIRIIEYVVVRDEIREGAVQFFVGHRGGLKID